MSRNPTINGSCGQLVTFHDLQTSPAIFSHSLRIEASDAEIDVPSGLILIISGSVADFVALAFIAQVRATPNPNDQ